MCPSSCARWTHECRGLRAAMHGATSRALSHERIELTEAVYIKERSAAGYERLRHTYAKAAEPYGRAKVSLVSAQVDTRPSRHPGTRARHVSISSPRPSAYGCFRCRCRSLEFLCDGSACPPSARGGGRSRMRYATTRRRGGGGVVGADHSPPIRSRRLLPRHEQGREKARGPMLEADP